MKIHDKYIKANREWRQVNGADSPPAYVAIEKAEVEPLLDEWRQATIGFMFPNRTAFDRNAMRQQIYQGTLMWMGMKVIVKEQVLV